MFSCLKVYISIYNSVDMTQYHKHWLFNSKDIKLKYLIICQYNSRYMHIIIYVLLYYNKI